MLKQSDACERNKQPILDILQNHIGDRKNILEIGSGTGQHVTFFAEQLPETCWQPSDLVENLPAIEARILAAALPNITAPIELNVSSSEWPIGKSGSIEIEAIYSANTLHIMSWSDVEQFFAGVGQYLKSGGLLAIYGPFRYNQSYTSESNRTFDLWLKNRDPKSGIRDFEAIEDLALQQRLTLVKDYNMPANNQMLIWHRQTL